VTPPIKRTDADIPELGNVYVSASQLETYWSCQRKWGWGKLRGLIEPSGKGAALGSLMHDQLEKYLRDGTPLNFLLKDAYGTSPAEIAAAGLQYLPLPQSPGLSVEQYFKFPLPGHPHIWVRGFKDYTVAPEFRPDGLPHVGDHKSCGNARYALTADDLFGNVQAIIYAYEELLKYPDAPAVSLQWTYYATKGRRMAWPVCATITREQVMEVFPEIIHGAVELAVTFLSKADPLSLPFNAEACDMYGGCPFKAHCNLNPSERQRYSMSTVVSTSDLIERLAQRKSQETGVPVEEAKANPDMSSFEAKLAAKLATPQSRPASPFPPTDQPVNCPTDYQPPPTSDQARKDEEVAALADIVPPKATKAGRPKGSKNLDGVDPALVTRFLTAGAEWYEWCLTKEKEQDAVAVPS
jgi:hypothetical protein